MFEINISNSNTEFDDQKNLSDHRIDHLKLIQDQLRNHLASLESINSHLENKANSCKDQDQRSGILKAISYNFDRILKAYETYQTYEQVIQRYYVLNSDTINKKYRMQIDHQKNIKTEGVSTDFFRKLNEYLIKKDSDEINDIAQIEDPEFNL